MKKLLLVLSVMTAFASQAIAAPQNATHCQFKDGGTPSRAALIAASTAKTAPVKSKSDSAADARS